MQVLRMVLNPPQIVARSGVAVSILNTAITISQLNIIMAMDVAHSLCGLDILLVLRRFVSSIFVRHCSFGEETACTEHTFVSISCSALLSLSLHAFQDCCMTPDFIC